MSWVLRMHGHTHVLLEASESCPAGGSLMSSEAASERLAELAAERTNMPALREAYTDGLRQPTSRTRSDFIVVAEVMSALRDGKLKLAQRKGKQAYGFAPPMRTPAPEPSRPETLHAEPEAEDEPVSAAAERSAAEPVAPAPGPIDPAAAAQAQALKDAARAGDPFCDELVD